MRWLAKPLKGNYAPSGGSNPPLSDSTPHEPSCGVAVSAPRGRATRRRVAPAAALTLALLGVTGCVERQLVVETVPAEAEVFVDGREVAREPGAPAVAKFDFYGVRVVTVRARGHRPVRRVVVLDPPWWQLTPLDLVTDLLWPGTLRDERRLGPVVLEPREDPAKVDVDALVRRADALALEERRP